MNALTRRHPVARALLALPLMACASQSFAATDTEPFQVTANVVSSCSIAAIADLAFGAYDPASITPALAQTTASVTCTLLTDYELTIDDGVNTGRRMKDAGTNYLDYDVYSDVARLLAWPSVAPGVAGVGLGLSAVPHLIYGSIPAGQDVPAGSYADTLTLTVTW